MINSKICVIHKETLLRLWDSRVQWNSLQSQAGQDFTFPKRWSEDYTMFMVFGKKWPKLASSRRSVNQGAAQKTAREKIKLFSLFFSPAVFCAAPWLTERLEEARPKREHGCLTKQLYESDINIPWRFSNTTGLRITFSADSSDAWLCEIVSEVLQVMPNAGETYIIRLLRSRGMRVQCRGSQLAVLSGNVSSYKANIQCSLGKCTLVR